MTTNLAALCPRAVPVSLSLFLLLGSLAPGTTQLAAQGEPPLVSSDDTSDVQRVPISLLAPDSLAGWQVTGCRGEVQNGVLRILEGDGLLRTDHQYGDYVLELAFRPLKDAQWDSGIYFRCQAPEGKRPWPRRYQINLKQGQEGNLIGVPQAQASQDLVESGEWNHFRLTVTGHEAALDINGKPAWRTDAIEPLVGFVGIQVEVPLGGQFEFKDIVLTELSHRSLFNGEDLSGWEGAGRDAALCWKVAEGQLICTGAKGPWLRSMEQFGDFNFRFEYRLLEGGNSGVYVRVPEDGNHHGKGAGVEIQILDDFAKRYAKLQPYQYSGSIYKIAPSTRHVGLPVGDWNSMEINCLGHDYTIVHNGTVIVDADLATFPKLEERLLEGYLGLQNHSEEVAFRRLRIGPPLPPEQLSNVPSPDQADERPPAPPQ